MWLFVSNRMLCLCARAFGNPLSLGSKAGWNKATGYKQLLECHPTTGVNNAYAYTRNETKPLSQGCLRLERLDSSVGAKQ